MEYVFGMQKVLSQREAAASGGVELYHQYLRARFQREQGEKGTKRMGRCRYYRSRSGCGRGEDVCEFGLWDGISYWRNGGRSVVVVVVFAVYAEEGEGDRESRTGSRERKGRSAVRSRLGKGYRQSANERYLYTVADTC